MPSPSPAEKPAAQKVRVFRITDIPDVMQRRLGWPIAAQLMRRWFKGAARTMTDEEKRGGLDPRTLPPAMLDDTTVSMQWVLRFPRVRLAYDRLLTKWNSPEGLRILALRIRTQAPVTLPKGHSSWRLGDLSQPCKVLDKTCQVNLIEVGSLNDPLDDFYGAMGKAGLKIAVTGQVTPQKNGKSRIAVDELAVYLRDTYDFNDDWFSQPLAIGDSAAFSATCNFAGMSRSTKSTSRRRPSPPTGFTPCRTTISSAIATSTGAAEISSSIASTPSAFA